ncbi:MAG: low molecular weight protein-tyrosine-phosphatase [Nocardioidaceae bacterium]
MPEHPAPPALPAARDPDQAYRIAMVCLGNICRSPMAQVVLTEQLEQAGLGDDVEVVSAGTGDWHAGDPMDPRAAAVLADAGYDPTAHRARQVDPSWFDGHDLLLAMDASNYADLVAMAPGADAAGRVRMFRDFDPVVLRARADGDAPNSVDTDVPDPWYGGPEGFASVLATVQRTAAVLVEALAAE